MRLQGQKRKRLKVNSACDACRDRKTRCDGRHPVCLACETRGCGQNCRYTRSRGSDVAAEPAILRHDQQQESTTPVNRFAPPPPSADSADSLRRTSPSAWESPAKESDGLATLTSYDDNSTYGSSSTVAFFRRILSADDAIKSAVRLERVEDGRPRQNTFAESNAGVVMLPRRRDADNFVACYWSFIHPMFPLLHKPTFLRQYTHFWTTGPENLDVAYFKPGRGHAVFLSMLNLVYALGCQFSDLIQDAQKTSVAYEFYERSKQCFRHDWLDSADLSVVQILLLNGVYLQSTRHANRCWNSVGLAIRVSQILGLHVEGQRSTMSQLERQMRRRIWHTCVSLDRLLSMTFGRPTTVHGPNIVPLPILIDDEYLQMDGVGSQPLDKPSYLGLFVNSCLLIDILRDVLHFVTTCEPDAEKTSDESGLTPIPRMVAEVLELNRRLDQFSKALPSYLRLSESEIETLQCDNEVGFQKKVLYCRFLLTRLLLLRPLLLATMAVPADDAPCYSLSETLDDGTIRQCCQLCISTAYNLIDAIYVNLGTVYRSSSWHSVYFTFSSAIVLLASLKSNVLDIQTVHSSFRLRWTRCLAILDWHKDHVHSAVHVIRLLRAVQQRMFKQDEPEATTACGGGPSLTPVSSHLSNTEAPNFGDGISFLDGNYRDCFGTNLTSLDWLELFQSEA